MSNRKKSKTKQRLELRRYSTRRLENWHQEFRQRQRANWCELVPEITFVLLKCSATQERAHLADIADEAVATYPRSFDTSFRGKKVPDYALVLLTLAQAKKREWGYAAGNWFKGWRLTKRGLAFARDVQRRRDELMQAKIACAPQQLAA
jgi:hypothetical protein